MNLDKLNYQKQIKLLKNKNLIIKNNKLAIHYLSEYSYFKLIKGIGRKYLITERDTGKKVFMPNISLKDLVSLHIFDMKMRSVLFSQILNIENSLDTKLSYLIDKTFTNIANGPRGYLNKRFYIKKSKTTLHVLRIDALDHIQDKVFNFNNGGRRLSKTSVRKLIGKYVNINKLYVSKPLIKCLLYGNHVPAWILMTTITFGNVTHWFNILKPIDKSKIMKAMLSLWNQKELNYTNQRLIDLFSSCLSILVKFRNACAHDDTLYNIRDKNILIKHHKTVNNYSTILSTLIFSNGKSKLINNDQYKKGSLYSCILSIILLTDDFTQLKIFIQNILIVLNQRYKELIKANKSNLININIPNGIKPILQKTYNMKFQ